MPQRRDVLGTLAIASASLLAGCTAPGWGSSHAKLVDLVVANQRSESSTIGVRLRNTETETLVKDYRVELEAAEETPQTGQLLDCDWPFRDPLVATATLLGDGGEVVDTHEIDTREVDSECLNITFYADRDERILATTGTDACDQRVMANYVDSCEQT